MREVAYLSLINTGMTHRCDFTCEWVLLTVGDYKYTNTQIHKLEVSVFETCIFSHIFTMKSILFFEIRIPS